VILRDITTSIKILKDSYVYITQQDAPHKDNTSTSLQRNIITNLKYPDLIPNKVAEFVSLTNPSSHTMALDLTQPQREMSSSYPPGVKGSQ
jgi:hypothetical protein